MLLLFYINIEAQILLEDKDGDRIASNFISGGWGNGNIPLIKLNTGAQALGFNLLWSNQNRDPSKYHISEAGITARPTEGYASVVSNGQFSPGIRLQYAFTRVNLFNWGIDAKSKPIDWLTINCAYEINRYPMFDRTTAFTAQFFQERFNGFTILPAYNLLLYNRYILYVSAGYSQQNNYNDLSQVEVKDIRTIVDNNTQTERQIINTRTASEGNFQIFNSFPLILSFTRATSTDAPTSPAAKALKFGYTIYLKNRATNVGKPLTNLGTTLFLTRQNDNGIRTPVFGINLQADDVMNTQDSGNRLSDRINIGFTTIFSL